MFNSRLTHSIKIRILKTPCYIIILLIGLQQGYGQDKKNNGIQIGITASFLQEGSELSNSYNNLFGAELNYFFLKKEKVNYFATSGFSSDIDGLGSALTTINIGAGIQYDILNIWGKSLYGSISAGALYFHEEFSTQLIEGTIQSTFKEFGFKVNLGIGYYISKKINMQFNLTQLHNLETTFGLGLYYNF